MEAKFIRVTSTSLLSYGALLDIIVSLNDEAKRQKVIDKSCEMNSMILTDAKFWKHAHHSNLIVCYLKYSWHMSMYLPYVILDVYYDCTIM